MRISISMLALFVIPFVASAQKEAKKEIEKPRVNQEQVKHVEENEPKQIIEEPKKVEETKPLEVTKPIEITPPANETKQAEQTPAVKQEELKKTPITNEAPAKEINKGISTPRLGAFRTIPMKATFKTGADSTKK